MRRRLVRFVVLISAITIAHVALAMSVKPGWSRPAIFAAMLGPAFLSCACSAWLLISWKRLAARVIRADGLLCLECAHDIRDAPDPACPRCGRAFAREHVQRRWREFGRRDA